MTDKLVIDIEALHPYQKDMLAMATQYQGKGCIQITGRQQGKSQMAAYARLFNDIMNSPGKVHDIRLGEGTVYGSRYYTAEPIGGNWLDMETWCSQVFGEGSRALWGEKKAPEPARRWYANNSKFWFKSEKDRDWFIVMWRS